MLAKYRNTARSNGECCRTICCWYTITHCQTSIPTTATALYERFLQLFFACRRGYRNVLEAKGDYLGKEYAVHPSTAGGADSRRRGTPLPRQRL